MEKPSHPTCRWSSRRTCTERGSAPSGGASYTLAASQTARNVSVSTAIAPTPGGELSKKKSGRVTLTCVGLKVGARWRVCGCDRGARLAAIAPMSVGKMVNRIGMGDVDAQWFRRASNPHPPDRCGRSAMLSYGTVSQPIRRTRWGSTRMGWNGGMGILRRRPHPLHR